MGSTFENLQTWEYNTNSYNIYNKTKMLSSKVAKLCSPRLGLLTVSRLFSSSTIRSSKNIPPGFAKRKEIQKMFNIDNGLSSKGKRRFTSLQFNTPGCHHWRNGIPQSCIHAFFPRKLIEKTLFEVVTIQCNIYRY